MVGIHSDNRGVVGVVTIHSSLAAGYWEPLILSNAICLDFECLVACTTLLVPNLPKGANIVSTVDSR